MAVMSPLGSPQGVAAGILNAEMKGEEGQGEGRLMRAGVGGGDLKGRGGGKEGEGRG